jgi:hypothetical protein
MNWPSSQSGPSSIQKLSSVADTHSDGCYVVNPHSLPLFIARGSPEQEVARQA